MPDRIIRGPLLNPRERGRVDFIPDAVLVGDERGRIVRAGTWNNVFGEVPRAGGIICPPFLDAHIHIPQHPIRGHFLDGVEAEPEAGRLIAGLNRNVFPAEARCADLDHARQVIRDFAHETLSQGVVGGCAYMTVHRPATELALEMLPDTWRVGMVLMNMNGPEDLRTDEPNLERDLTKLFERFGNRCVLTDRFAVAVDSSLRRRAVAIAKRLGMSAQTHLNEQVQEKRLVEHTLYPDAGSYAQVYERDGLLDLPTILAHCVHCTEAEWQLIAARSCVIAHCPVSNTELASGVMPLDRQFDHGIDYALCTDVGAAPTTSLLNEMSHFLEVHAPRSQRATPSEALYRCTLAPARILGLDTRLGSFEPGKDLSYVVVQPARPLPAALDADNVIASHLLQGQVMSVALAGRVVWRR